MADPVLRAFLADDIVRNGSCPNVTPGAVCVDPECVYCRIAAAEEPAQGDRHTETTASP